MTQEEDNRIDQRKKGIEVQLAKNISQVLKVLLDIEQNHV